MSHWILRIVVGSYVYKEFSRTGFAAGGELGGLTVEARRFGLEMPRRKMGVAENPDTYIFNVRESRPWTGVSGATLILLLGSPTPRSCRNRSPQGTQGITEEARRGAFMLPHVRDTDVH